MCDHRLVSETTRMNASIVARATVDSEHVCEAHRGRMMVVVCMYERLVVMMYKRFSNKFPQSYG